MPAALCRVQQMGGLRTGIRPVHIVATSKMVCDYSGMMVQPHKVTTLSSTGSWAHWNNKKKDHYIFFSQLGADQMPGPLREVQLTCELFLDWHQYT